jgi:hypothetical protein
MRLMTQQVDLVIIMLTVICNSNWCHVLSSGVVNYSSDVPAIKPARNLIKFLVNRVINKDEMIIEPVVTIGLH